MSTPDERLLLIFESYRNAYERRAGDWKKATTPKQAIAIAQNVEALERHYLDAARNALDKNSAEVAAVDSDAKQD